jgi:ABC-type transport system substrate-binding protein
MEESSKQYSRREFFKLAGLAGAAVAGAGAFGGLIAACGGATTTTTAASTVTTAGGTATTAGIPTTATSAGAAGKPVVGGVAKIAVMSSPAKFGVPADVIGPDQWFEGLFLESLINPTTKPDEYIPTLADSWELSADKLSYTFKLHKGVKFHDGTDFNAAACKFCWDLMMPAATPAAGGTATTAAAVTPTTTAAAGPPAGGPPAGPPPDFAWVKSVEVIDDYTVKVTANAWSNQILPFISRKSWSVFSPTAYQSMGKDKMDTNPVGTGAFKLKSFTANQSLVLEKFADYYMKDADGNQLPYLDGIEIQIFQDPTTMVMAVQSGQVDGADHIPPTGAQQLSADKNFSLEHFGGPVDMLTMNMTDAASVWSKVQMRQALEYAIDKEGISKSVGLGMAPAVYTIIHSIADAADPGTTPRKYDPEKAKALMQEAGVSTVDATLTFNSTESDPALSTAVQANLAAVGINVKLNPMPAASFAPLSVKPPTGNDLIFNGERGGAPNVLQGAVEMFGKGTIYFPAAKFPDEFYAALDKAGSADTVAGTYPDCVAAEKAGYEAATVVPVMMEDFISVSGAKLKNLKWNFANLPGPRLQDAWLEK